MKKILFYGMSIVLLLSLQGCSFFGLWDSEPSTPQEVGEAQEATSSPTLSSSSGRNYVKGVVKSLKRDKNSGTWNYVIEGVDMTNGKLPRVNFNHNVIVANEGDLVHASFDGGKLVDLLILKAGHASKTSKRPATQAQPVGKKVASPKDAGKRSKSSQVLSVPQEEFIKLN